MNILTDVLFTVAAAFLAVVLKEYKPEFSFLLTIAATALVLLFIINSLLPYIKDLYNIFESAGIKSEYFYAVLKAVIICYISKFAADLCRDNGQSALADKAELAGRVSLIILSLPFFKSIVNVATSLIA